MKRIESLALGISAGALLVGFLGPGKVVAAGIVAAVISYAVRRWVAPWLGF